MSFSAIQITAKGRALLAKAQIGTTLNFTRIKMGDGSMTGQVIDDMTDVISQKASLALTELKVLAGGKAKVSAEFSNSGLSTGFYWKEIAVFATDPDVGEIMYCYGNAGNLADYIPAEGSQILEKHVSVITIISNTSSVTATIDSSNVYLTAQEAETAYVKKSLATAADQVLVSSGIGAWAVKTLAQVKTWLGLGSAAYTNSNAYATAAQGTTADNTAAALTTHLAETTVLSPQSGSTANAIVLAITPTANMSYKFKAAADNTGNMTINTKPFLKLGGSQIPASGIKSGKVYEVYYDTESGGRFFLLARSSGTAQPSQVLADIPYSNEDGEQVGTMPNRGGEEYAGWRRAAIGAVPPTSGRLHLAIPTGAYLSETSGQGAGLMGIFYDDPNFSNPNIKKDVPMLGLVGTLEAKQAASGTAVIVGSSTARVRGLSFRPSVVIAQSPSNNLRVSLYATGLNVKTLQIYESGASWSFYNATITDDGFDVEGPYLVSTGQNFNWWAFS